mgnify:FL=1
MFCRRMRLPRLLVLCAGLTSLASTLPAADYEPIPLDGFSDVIHHWRNQNDMYGREYPRYAPGQIVEIADNLVLRQRANGGWPTNQDPARIIPPEERRELRLTHNATDTSFDNRNTYPQIEYLAAAYVQAGQERHRDACLRGIDFVLDSQYPNGGWAHSPPRTDSYYGHITFADDVMPGVLRLLRKIAAGKPPFSFVDETRRARAAEAVARGDGLILRLQVVSEGRRAVWAGQYDRETLEPAKARSFELPALVSRESVQVVRYLMSIEDPSPEIIRAVEDAAAWFERTKIRGLRLERRKAAVVRYDHHTAKDDLVAVPDPDAPVLWARFYELADSQPFLANRDGRKVYTLAEVERERRTGYDWYGPFATELLEKEIPAWRARIAAKSPTR